MLARVKLKGIDGGPHKRWSMWFNSMQREEPYQGLTWYEFLWKEKVPFGTYTQVVHGCRQLVSWDVGLSPATSATLVSSWFSLERLPIINRRKVRTTSSHHAPYVLGYTRATMGMTKSSKFVKTSQSQNIPLVQIVGCNSPTWRWNR